MGSHWLDSTSLRRRPFDSLGPTSQNNTTFSHACCGFQRRRPGCSKRTLYQDHHQVRPRVEWRESNSLRPLDRHCWFPARDSDKRGARYRCRRPDQTLNGITQTALHASVCDDALPSNTQTHDDLVEGFRSGHRHLRKPNLPVTSVNFSAPGTYTLRMTATDSVHTGSDTLRVTVIPGNQAPVVNAGPDQTISFVAAPTAFINNLAGFNAAAGLPPVTIDFDNIASGTDISGQTIAGIKFDLGNQPAPSAPLVVVRGSDTFTPAGFSIAPNPSTNKLFATSGENVLSPGGAQLAPGTNPLLENDDLKLTLAQPVSAVGLDILFQSLDCCSFVSVTVLDVNGQVLYTNVMLPTGSAPGGVPGGSVFFGFVSPTANIKTVVIDESDATADFPDSNVGIDSVRIGSAIPEAATAILNGTATDDGLPVGSTLVATWTKLSGPGLVAFGNIHQPQTTASFTVAGTYVLRLEASDSDKGAFDDVSITVLPRPNRPPDITSEPLDRVDSWPGSDWQR